MIDLEIFHLDMTNNFSEKIQEEQVTFLESHPCACHHVYFIYSKENKIWFFNNLIYFNYNLFYLYL